MKSGVYVRAQSRTSGRYLNVLAENLTQESFRLFVLDKLSNVGAVTFFTDEACVPRVYETDNEEED